MMPFDFKAFTENFLQFFPDFLEIKYFSKINLKFKVLFYTPVVLRDSDLPFPKELCDFTQVFKTCRTGKKIFNAC
jgi:hypothetical protein